MGTNKLVQSIIEKKGGNLTSALNDANNFVIKANGDKKIKEKKGNKK